MTLRSEIRDALATGPKTAAQLVDLCTSAGDANAMANNLYALKKEGKVKIAGSIEGRNSYIVADWPEKAVRETSSAKRTKASPPPRTKRAYKKRKASGARPAEPAAAPPLTNGAASFAILDNGILSLIKHDVRVDLDTEEFARLRKFIESTDNIWNT